MCNNNVRKMSSDAALCFFVVTVVIVSLLNRVDNALLSIDDNIQKLIKIEQVNNEV